MPIRGAWLAVAGFAALLSVAPADAGAQKLGIGPRLSFVRGHVPDAESPATRFAGGTLRISSSKHIVLEATLDYRAEFSDDKSTRVR